MDIQLPREWATHPGPQFGIEGSRRSMGVPQSPMSASIIKPSPGLTADETNAFVARLCKAGVDFIKDDEKLMSPAYSLLCARIDAIMPVIKQHEQKTGKRFMYAFEISSADPVVKMQYHHHLVVAANGNAVVISINSIGYAGMSFIRKRSALCLHAYGTGHPAGLTVGVRAIRQAWDAAIEGASLGKKARHHQELGVSLVRWG